jgi:hypothetical protein
VEHFLLVSDLLAPDRPPVAANNVADLATRYYHLGFHAMAAWMLALAGVSTPHSLLVLGQLMQTAVIGAVYFPVYAAVRDARAALVAVLLAGAGWSMPSYASNWAKYPALLGLAVLPVVGGMTILGLGARGKRRYLALMAAGLAALVSVLIHTRMLFLIAAFILSIEFARRQGLRDEERGFKRRWILPIAVLLLIAVPSVLLASSANIEAARQTVLRFVYGQGLVSTLLVLLLTPFALRSHRAASLAAISLASLILLFQLLPPNASYPFPILDAPMASMALFLPLSCLGGLGASGIDSYLHSARLGPRVGRYGRPALAFGAVLYVAWSLSVQPESPGECCLLARQDDVTVVKAASGLLPPDSRTLIPSEAQVGYGPLASDGGAWLFALAQRRTILWPSDADLSSPSEHARLCSQDISYIYVGGTPWGFSREMLDLAPAFYAPTIALPGAAIYSVKGCEVSRGKPGQFGIESSPTALRRDQGCPASAQGCELRPGRDPV